MVPASDIMVNAVGKTIFEDLVSQALATGKPVAGPDPLVIEKGRVTLRQLRLSKPAMRNIEP